MQRGREHARQYKHLVHGRIYMYILAMYRSMCSGLTLKIKVARCRNMEYCYNMYDVCVKIGMLEYLRLGVSYDGFGSVISCRPQRACLDKINPLFNSKVCLSMLQRLPHS